MLRFLSVRRLAALSVWVATTASAQTIPAPAAPAPPPQTVPTTAYRSAFEGYQPYTDQKIAPWKESNDTVGKVGGWRAYAKEAQPSPAPGGGQPASGGAANPHAGHGKQP